MRTFALILFIVPLFVACKNYNLSSEDHVRSRSAVFDEDTIVSSIKSPPPPAVIKTSAGNAPSAQSTYIPKVSSNRPRYALVIGNSRYRKGNVLANPANDSRDIANALRRLHFDVSLITDANQQRMEKAIQSFGKKLGKDSIGLFYYAGHAVQHAGENYLIPVHSVDALTSAEQLRYKTVNAGYILGLMESAGNGLNIVMLDACRDNPFRSFSRSMGHGLAQISSPKGSLIAYATSPGDTAADGTGTRNSPYTKNLLTYIEQPGLTIEAMFKRVGAGVSRDTNSEQVPWYSSSISQDFYLAE